MLKLLKWAAILVAGVAVLILLVGFLLPSGYAVERSIVIAAEPARVHVLVGDLARWPEWTPWGDMDPTLETVLGEQTEGVGAGQTWTGKDGGGALTFTASDPETGLTYDMTFNEGGWVSQGVMTYDRTDAGTRVTWRFEGDVGANPIGRYMGLAMDAFVGPAFEAGLDKLKAQVESLPPEEEPAAEEDEAETPGAE
jgi:hypothetical protein